MARVATVYRLPWGLFTGTCNIKCDDIEPRNVVTVQPQAAASPTELSAPLPHLLRSWARRCQMPRLHLDCDAAAQVFGIIAVVAVWVILNKSAGGTYECLDVGVGCGRAAALSASACVRGPLQ